MSGSGDLDESAANHDADLIGHPAECQQRERQVEVSRQRKRDDAQTERRHADEQRDARAPEGRTVREIDADEKGSNGRRGAKDAETLRSCA